MSSKINSFFLNIGNELLQVLTSAAEKRAKVNMSEVLDADFTPTTL